MGHRGRHIAASLAGLAGAGIVAAHQLGFYLAEHDAHSRAHHMDETGHGHWETLVMGVLALLVAGLACHCARVWTRPELTIRPRRVGARLVSIQSIGFVALEVIERSTSASSFTLPAWNKAFVLGLVLQLLTAAVGVLLLRLLTRAVKELARAVRGVVPETRGSVQTLGASRQPFVRSRLETRTRTSRGPPLVRSIQFQRAE